MLRLNFNRRDWFFFRATSAGAILRVYRNVIELSGALSAVIALLFVTAHANAAEIEPRAYLNTPVGINFLLAGCSYSDGGLSTEASSPLKDAHLKIQSGVLAYARALDVWGKSGKIDVILPYSHLSGKAVVDGQPRERIVSGLNDPRIRFSINLYGAPALSLKEFAGYHQNIIIGASIQVSAPLGQYDKDRLVNIGNNRWFVKPEIGISKAWGTLVMELSAGVFLFSKNDDFFIGRTLEQDPVYTTQLHVTYTLSSGVWAAISGTLDYGGRTTVDGVRHDDSQNNSRVGVTLGVPVNRKNSIKLFASSGAHIRIGNNYDMGGIVWQYRWGSGL
jgi:hypothetical protein